MIADEAAATAEAKARWASFAAVVRGDQPPALIPASVRQAARSNALHLSASAARTNTMRLQGVFLRTGAPSAIISGHDVVEGDSVEGSKVVKIEASRVVMQNAQGEMFNLTYQ